MAFNAAKLSAIVDTVAGGYPPFFVYPTDDEYSEIVADGYFTHGVKRGLQVGSTIIVLNPDTEEEYLLKVSGFDNDNAAVVRDISELDVRRMGFTPGTDPTDAQLEKNNRALERIAESGQVWRLPAGETYAFSRGVTFVSNAGLWCDGWCNFLMKTGEGEFDTTENHWLNQDLTSNVDYVHYDSTSRTLFQNEVDATGIFIKGLDIQLEANDDTRTAGVANFYKADELTLDIRVREFKENFGGVVRIRSCSKSSIRVEGFDLDMNSVSLPFMQVTVIEVDDDIGTNAVTQNSFIHGIGHNWHFGATARAEYADQTDIVNIQSRARLQADPTVFLYANNRIIAESHGGGAGDILDIWGTGNDCTVLWDDCRGFGVKVLNGASYNTIRAKGTGTGLSACYMNVPPSGTRQQPAVGNIIDLDVIDVGRRYSDYYEGNGNARQGGVQIEGDGQALLADKPHDNIIRGRVEGFEDEMPYAIVQNVAGVNDIRLQSSTFDTKFAWIDVDANSAEPNVERVGYAPFRIRAHYATTGPTTFNHGDALPFSTEDVDTGGNFNPTTKVITFPVPGFYPITGVVRVSSLAAGKALSLSIGGIVIAGLANEAATSVTTNLPFSTLYQVTTAGETGTIILGLDDASTVNLGGASDGSRTWLAIGPPLQYHPHQ